MNITITGLSEALASLGAYKATVVDDIAYAVGKIVEGRVAVAPGPAHKPVIWASAKQRRWWFWHRRKQELPLEYTRNSDAESQRLEASWATRRAWPGAIVGTRVTYAPWVQSATQTENGGPQTAQHKATGWITDAAAVEQTERSGDVQRIASSIVRKALGIR